LLKRKRNDYLDLRHRYEPHSVKLVVDRARPRRVRGRNDLVGKSDVEVREAIGEKFPKHIYYSITCIGALIAHNYQLRIRKLASYDLMNVPSVQKMTLGAIGAKNT
jgi:hypothetical protein